MTQQEALKKLAALCARSEHSTGDIDAKMRQWGLSADDRQAVTIWLVGHQYIDDERFARAFAHDKLLYNHWGRRKIEQALWQKGVGESIYTAVLDDIDSEEYIRVLRPLLQNKANTTKANSPTELRQKLLRFALGRGFSWDEAQLCLQDILR